MKKRLRNIFDEKGMYIVPDYNPHYNKVPVEFHNTIFDSNSKDKSAVVKIDIQNAIQHEVKASFRKYTPSSDIFELFLFMLSDDKYENITSTPPYDDGSFGELDSLWVSSGTLS